MTGPVCAIHQPNFFPWLGYFDKLRQADVMILLDAVAYPRAGSGGMGSWTNRVKLQIGGEARWIGCPVKRMPLGAAISEAVIDDGQPWRAKLIKTLHANYRRAARFEAGMAMLEPLILGPQSKRASFNIAAIDAIAQALELSCRLVRQSSLVHEGQATALLVSLTKAVGAEIYLAGGGAGGYQEDELFPTAGVALRYQDFQPRIYGPPGRFTPGLSVIDYLMHDGRPLAEAFPDG